MTDPAAAEWSFFVLSVILIPKQQAWFLAAAGGVASKAAVSANCDSGS